MRRRLHIAALTGAALAGLAAVASAPAHAAVDVTGLWSLNDGTAEISISECGGALCGHLVNARKIEAEPGIVDKKNRNPVLRPRKLKGIAVLAGFTGGPTEWKGGTIYNPDDGGTYHATIKVLDADTLKVTGCIIRPLCKSAKLTRMREDAGEDNFSVAKRAE